jgi:hypothetical protein
LPGNFFALVDGAPKYLPPFLSLPVLPRSDGEAVSTCLVMVMGLGLLFGFAAAVPDDEIIASIDNANTPGRKTLDISASNRGKP